MACKAKRACFFLRSLSKVHGVEHVVLDLMDFSSHEPRRWLAVEDHVAAEGVGRAEKL